ncbi:hypothetical protein METBIDRAFT_44970 [Metschnikowia bicuspidata var. bicuspidata NRRL YB-4993]|uniref:Activator of Hsp90 ATPase AHSA1-like N-terminal domain-containing protein n=1 Tax=Metschnikowia bicuspidata var. bicuspidata NRRL YB-4993 TaxID=869754 RepID=A0A1A0H815_9ASCO|nr:hypothetical protein METBIDRAFT_44970 [Metschnikowia bicuspidata var. bicuspidata NRRL YB-4993]OBA20038.1 hypothetical protein METBIDRAFT_44970 [Metschnikowia bicuspidata var. bicuspidata NRRL YB-4993]
MVVNNPNNWHWVDKNCIDWSKAYFNSNLIGLSAKTDDNRDVQVKAISSLEGDVEVCQRKGKVISIFDLRIVLNIEGSSAQDKDFKGSITVPELAYDTEEDELQFDISIYNEDSDSEKMRIVIKKELVPQIKSVLMNFGGDLIKEHGSDIQHESDKVHSKLTKENQSALQAKEAKDKEQAQKPAPVPSARPVTETSSSSVPKYNTSTLHLEPTFNTTAEQLYITLLDPARVSAWSRSNAQIQAKEGSEFLLFGGSISGKILELVTNERIRQAWRLDSWRTGHFAELDIQLKQGAGETTMVVKWSGIPIGDEDRVKGNFQDYYVRAIKLTFGFGAVL